MSLSYPFTMLFHVLHLNQFEIHIYEIFVFTTHSIRRTNLFLVNSVTVF